MTGPARILLADADQFFVAVARLVDPEGAGKAALLIVGGAPGSRGVVCSASYETRKFGVRSAMPISRALRLCPDALCVPVPRSACSAKSREIRTVLERFTPVVRGASIDEWYLDLGGTEALYHHEPLHVTARRIRDAVTADTGLSVSLGGGSNRLIAKLAVEFAKPKPGSDGTGVFVVAPDDGPRFMAERIALADIPGIGPKFQRELAVRDLVRVADILPYDQASLVRWFGDRTGAWLWQRARGFGDAIVSPREAQKQVSRVANAAGALPEPRACAVPEPPDERRLVVRQDIGHPNQVPRRELALELGPDPGNVGERDSLGHEPRTVIGRDDKDARAIGARFRFREFHRELRDQPVRPTAE